MFTRHVDAPAALLDLGRHALDVELEATSTVRPTPSGYAVAASSAPCRSAITIRMPSCASRSAIAFPMPFAPPVTMATCPRHQTPAMHRYFVSSQSSMPYFEPSRPMPDSFMPPNGATSVEMTPGVDAEDPVSSCSETRQMRDMSRE